MMAPKAAAAMIDRRGSLTRLRESVAWRIALTAAPVLVCMLIIAVLISAYTSTEPGTMHRLAELLLIPAVIAFFIFFVRVAFDLFEIFMFRRRGGWGYDASVGGFYGEYGEGFKSGSGSGSGRRRRRKRR